jgi:hypothetical protein
MRVWCKHDWIVFLCVYCLLVASVAAEPKKPDPAKLLKAVQARMAMRIRYAESESFKVNPRVSIHGSAGFRSAVDFCRARDWEYQLCEQLLEEASK